MKPSFFGKICDVKTGSGVQRRKGFIYVWRMVAERFVEVGEGIGDGVPWYADGEVRVLLGRYLTSGHRWSGYEKVRPREVVLDHHYSPCKFDALAEMRD